MLIPGLKLQMLQFVRHFYVVKERQIRKFFADWGEGSVEFLLRELLNSGQFIQHGPKKDYISFLRHLPHDLEYYEPCIRAIDVMTTLRSQKVVWFNREDFPLEIVFGTTDSKIYDVVIFDDFWVAKYAAIKRMRDQYYPAGEPDPTDHIAIVPYNDPDDNIAKKVADLGFTLYAEVDPRDGHVSFFEL